MNRIIILLSLCFSVSLTSLAQSAFVGTYEDATFTSYSVFGPIHPLGTLPWADPVQLGPNDYMSVVMRDSFYVAMRHDGNGKPAWTRKIRPLGKKVHLPYYLLRTADGNVVLVNDFIFQSSAPNTFGITKISPDGDILYMRELVTGTIAGITVPEAMPDSGFMIGSSGCIGFNYLFKFDKDGQVAWYGQYGDAGTPSGQYGAVTAIRKTGTDRYKALGRLSNIGLEAFDVDANGNLIRGAYFLRPDGQPLQVNFYNMANSGQSDGSLYIACSMTDFSGTTSSNRSMLVARIDTNNNLIWSKRLLWTDSTQMYDPRIRVLPGGDLLLTNNHQAGDGTYPSCGVALIQISKDGDFLDAQMVGREGMDAYHFEQNYGSILNAYDTSILLVNATELGWQLSRQRINTFSAGSCNQNKLNMISYDFPLNRYTFSSGGPMGHWATAAIPFTVASLYPTISYSCGDTLSYNGPTAIAATQHTNQQTLEVYPNPAQDRVWVHAPQMNGEVSVELWSGTGIRVQQQKAWLQDGKGSISVKEVPAGIYMVRLNSGAGTVSSSRITVLR